MVVAHRPPGNRRVPAAPPHDPLSCGITEETSCAACRPLFDHAPADPSTPAPARVARRRRRARLVADLAYLAARRPQLLAGLIAHAAQGVSE